MAGRSRGRNPNNRFHYVNPRSEHDDRSSRPSTSRGGGGYSECHNFSNKVTFKANNRGGSHFRKSWDTKTNLLREQFDSEFSNRNGQHRSNPGRRSFPERNHNRGSGSHGNFRNSSWTLKESSTGWYSVFVPNGDDCEEAVKIIKTYITPTTFFAHNIQYFDNGLRFLVDDFKIAKILHNTSYKIPLRDDRKLIIKVCSYLPPRGPISFTPVSKEVREKMIEAMAARYNPSTKSLDLSRFYMCPLFTENRLFVPLNRPAVLLAALNMVAEHTKHDLFGLSLEDNHIYLGEGLIWIRRLFPELKVLDLGGNKLSDLKELKSLSGFTIEVLNLSRNPVCDTEDKERYQRDVQQLFPILKKLDNSPLPSRYSAVVGSKLKMPINLGNSYPIPEGHNPEQPNPVLALVESFLTQYYELYDNKLSRQMVGEAYNQNATFSLSSAFRTNNSKGSLAQYIPESRNFFKCERNKNGRNRYLHKGKENIVNFLEKLPKTQHDLGSFLVDVPLANAVMVQIVVNGVFAEDFKETSHMQVFRSFSRTFSIVPVGSGWSIISDMMFVTVVTDELLIESSKRFHIFKSKPVSTKKNSFNGNNNNGTMFMEDTDEMICMESSSPYQQQSTPNYPPPPYQETSFSSYQPSQMSTSVISQQPPPYQETSFSSYQPSQMSTSVISQQPPPYQETSFSSYQPSQMSTSVISQQPPPYQETSFSLYQPSQMSTSVISQQPPPYQGSVQNQQVTFQEQINLATPSVPAVFQLNSEQSFPTFNATPTVQETTFSTPAVSIIQPSIEVSTNSIGNSNTNPDKLTMVKSFSNESGMNHEWAEKCLIENDWDYANAALCFSKLKANIPPAAFVR